MKSMSSVPFEAVVTINSREAGDAPFFPGNQFRIGQQKPNQFRMSMSNHWGDGFAYISDGKTFMIDPLDLEQAIVLKEAGAAPWDAEPSLMPGRDNATVFLLVATGERALTLLAEKEAAVTTFDPGKGRTGIRIKGKAFGTADLIAEKVQGRLMLVESRYDNLAQKQSAHDRWPEWVGPPQAGTLDIESVDYVSVGRTIPADLLDTRPPKGIRVDDQRPPKKP